MIFQAILGTALLLFGRRLFWLFVGAAGFLAGSRFGALAFADHPYWVTLAVAAAGGIAGVVIAIVFQRAAFAVGGFFAGAYLVGEIALRSALFAPSGALILVGGAVGAVVAVLVMDWAIIWLSCLVGAGAVAGAVSGPTAWGWGLWIGLFVLGYIFQTRTFRKPEARRPQD